MLWNCFTERDKSRYVKCKTRFKPKSLLPEKAKT